jgi:hypothetical protein
VTSTDTSYSRTLDPIDAPNKPYEFSIYFEKGIPVKVITEDKKEVTDSLDLFKLLNKIGHDNGVGRVDIVENRFIGLKSRGCYDTPGLYVHLLQPDALASFVLANKTTGPLPDSPTLTSRVLSWTPRSASSVTSSSRRRGAVSYTTECVSIVWSFAFYLADALRLFPRARVCRDCPRRLPEERHRCRPHGRLPWQCEFFNAADPV